MGKIIMKTADGSKVELEGYISEDKVREAIEKCRSYQRDPKNNCTVSDHFIEVMMFEIYLGLVK